MLGQQNLETKSQLEQVTKKLEKVNNHKFHFFIKNKAIIAAHKLLKFILTVFHKKEDAQIYIHLYISPPLNFAT